MKLKKYLNEHGISQLELSRRTGIASNMICNVCNDKMKPFPGWIKKITEALNVSEEEIF